MPENSWEHAAEARAALNAIVTDPEHGVAALSSAQTMSNLLKDLLPDAPREKSILVAAAEAGLADTLREHVAQGMDPSTAIRLTATSFSNATPFTPDACTWVTGELATALGIAAGPADLGGAGSTPHGPGQVDQGGMPTQINPIPGFGAVGGQASAPDPAQAQYPTGAAPPAFPAPQSPAGQAYPTQAAPQAFPGPGQAPGAWQPGPGGYGQGAPAAGYAPGGPPGYAPGGQVGYGPGGQPGYGPGAPVGFGPPPRKPSGTKRGLLVGGGILVVIIVIIVIAAALSSKGTPSANGSSTPPSPPPTTSTTPPTPPPVGGVEALNTIMNPAGQAPVGTSCQLAQLGGLDAATLMNRTFCTKTSINFVPTNHIVVWAYQFDSNADYLAGFSKINSITGFKSAGAGTRCPPATTSQFDSEVWFAFKNPKYNKSHEQGQHLECFTQYTKSHVYAPLMIWTMQSQHVVFISRNEAHGGTSAQLYHWWTHLNYG